MNRNNCQWGDSTAHNTIYLEEIYSCFPNAKYVFLIRDGRDVVSAFKKERTDIFGGLAHPEKSTAHWIRSIMQFEKINKKTKVLIVKYEELVLEPQRVLTRILKFLGKEYTPNLLEFHKSVPELKIYEKPYHGNLHKPIQTSSIGQWESILDANEKELVMPRLSPYLKRFNYTL